MGRPTKYDPSYVRWAERFARRGFTQAEIAELLEVDVSTLERWLVAYPEFRGALKVGASAADDRVERTLYERATGYKRWVERPVVVKCGKDQERVEIVRVLEELPPDVTAQIFWLKNRDRENWRDRHDHELTGQVTWVRDDPTQRPAGYDRKSPAASH